MIVKKLNIVNFKGFEGKFSIEFQEGLNVLVGDNESGKSTILEALHLCLSGIINGRYIRNELTQYIFNYNVVTKYVEDLEKSQNPELPHILIEVFFEGDDLAILEGDANSEKTKSCCVTMKIAFDEEYKLEYEALIKSGSSIKTIPIEYYNVYWKSCARDQITARSIPVKSALIDSSTHRFQNGSDIYISRIIKEILEKNEVVDISQAYRKLKEQFMDDTAIKEINKRIKTAAKISDKEVKLSVDLSPKNAWETSLMTYLDDIPFHHIGRGEQCIVKTKLALAHKKSKEANILLIEEPENHLSHTKLNELIWDIQSDNSKKQILVSTHSSFVANKLGLEKLTLLNERQKFPLKNLSPDTKVFFQKLSGYDTLRLILCKKAILVEGDSDELIIQKAYFKKFGKLPIQSNVDVISVGTTFLRFLEIAEKLGKPVSVVTDNDGDVDALEKKYENFLGLQKKPNIIVCFDSVEDTGDLTIGKNNKPFNYNTLEPKIVKVNGLQKMNEILGKSFSDINDLHRYMRSNKTDCALKIFDTDKEIQFPDYITDAIQG